MRPLLGLVLLTGLAAFVGCGTRGLASSPATSNASFPAPATSSAQPPASVGDLSNSNAVTVTAGEDISGVNITVSPATGTENAIALGTLADGFAANTGAIVHQASSNTIVLFGAGLSGAMSVTLSGPQDMGVSNLRSVQAKDGTPGIAFDAVVGSSTAIGARTVYLKASNNDITALAGGLEVLP
ncbi:MAG TPA: hypothetical protein VG498_04280 [Terriglobales bacterium]|nr:hypothetical protein [Terriglobales bacterium]